MYNVALQIKDGCRTAGRYSYTYFFLEQSFPRTVICPSGFYSEWLFLPNDLFQNEPFEEITFLNKSHSDK